MRVSHSYAVLHFSLSRMVVSDVPRRLPTWAPIEFYAAIEAMDSVEDCMRHIEAGTTDLTGWRLFSSSHRMPSGQIVQWVRGAERLLIKGEAIAYARPAVPEVFHLSPCDHDLSEGCEVPQELRDFLGGHT